MFNKNEIYVLVKVIFTLILCSYEYIIKQKIVYSITCMCKTIILIIYFLLLIYKKDIIIMKQISLIYKNDIIIMKQISLKVMIIYSI